VFYNNTKTNVNEEQMFRSWMKDHSKVYASEGEYAKRLANFRANLRRNEQLRSAHTEATFGMNKFADVSIQEFKQTVLMRPFDPNDTCIWPYHRVAKVQARQIPTSFDWRTKGAVSPVKNQQSCGSCWTFSTAENIEGQWFLAGHSPVPSLSEQWIVDCSHGCLQSEPDLCNGGCGGGLPWLAYQDIITNAGLTSEADYPYVGYAQNCPSSEPAVAQIANWTALDTDFTDIITYMQANGPLSITLNADLLMSYSGGVITGDPSTCPNSGSDHAVLLVGYDTTKSQASVNFWIVKNSWGTDWGENGYFRIEADNGLCGINACVTSACVSGTCPK
jgi:cathepsin F